MSADGPTIQCEVVIHKSQGPSFPGDLDIHQVSVEEEVQDWG
jgi:hypothetical protein